MMQNDDQEIIAQLKQESTREVAFHRLVSMYQEPLYWHVRKILLSHEDSDDVLQNTFIKVWKSIHKFREESSLYTWLYRIATNEAITCLNNNKRRSMLPLNEVSDILMHNLNSDPYLEGDKIQLKLQEAIVQLPEKQRIVFNLRYFDEMKYDDMAAILDTSVGALKASYHHAVKKVEEYMKNTD
ncbi:MAG: RNA polymerase sigma factor [Mariniphaga sp.]|nr:RNA polymerase sigma factor [Mariniphaga sp.]MDD4227086.1 RNA polymerase sigma factor [Mariniphaga sp.]